MDIQDIRRLRLKSLIDQEDSAADFARKYDLNESYLSQLLNKHRGFGERAARKIEAAVGLERFTLDAVDVDMLSPDQLAWLALYEKLTADQRAAVVNVAEQMSRYAAPPPPQSVTSDDTGKN